MTQQPDEDERLQAVRQRINEMVPAALDTLADLVAKGDAPTIKTMKERGLEAEIEQRLRARGGTMPPLES